MTTESIFILAGIVSAFVIFAVTLAWGTFQTRNLPKDRTIGSSRPV